jgi:hypothetical protein
LELDAFKSPAHDAAEDPMKRSDQQQNPLLRPGKVAAENIRQGNSTADYADIEPPDHPAANANMNVHGNLSLI